MTLGNGGTLEGYMGRSSVICYRNGYFYEVFTHPSWRQEESEEIRPSVSVRTKKREGH